MMTAKAVKNSITGRVTQLASPSIPSVKFTAFTIATATKIIKIKFGIQGIGIVISVNGINRFDLKSPIRRSPDKNAAATASCRKSF